MTIKNIVFSSSQPNSPHVLWARPMGPDSWAFYIHFNGRWQPMQVAKSKGTPWGDDDETYNLDAAGAKKLADLEDVALSTLEEGQVLKYKDSSWENAEDDSSTPGPSTVGTDQLVNNSVMEDDLNESVRQKIQKTYHEDDEALHMDYDVVDQQEG